MTDLERITQSVEKRAEKICQVNDQVWEYAELAYHETRSADLLCQILKDEGFSVTTGDAGSPPASQEPSPTVPESRSWASWGNMTPSPP